MAHRCMSHVSRVHTSRPTHEAGGATGIGKSPSKIFERWQEETLNLRDEVVRLESLLQVPICLCMPVCVTVFVPLCVPVCEPVAVSVSVSISVSVSVSVSVCVTFFVYVSVPVARASFVFMFSLSHARSLYILFTLKFSLSSLVLAWSRACTISRSALQMEGQTRMKMAKSFDAEMEQQVLMSTFLSIHASDSYYTYYIFKYKHTYIYIYIYICIYTHT